MKREPKRESEPGAGREPKRVSEPSRPERTGARERAVKAKRTGKEERAARTERTGTEERADLSERTESEERAVERERTIGGERAERTGIRERAEARERTNRDERAENLKGTTEVKRAGDQERTRSFQRAGGQERTNERERSKAHEYARAGTFTDRPTLRHLWGVLLFYWRGGRSSRAFARVVAGARDTGLPAAFAIQDVCAAYGVDCVVHGSLSNPVRVVNIDVRTDDEWRRTEWRKVELSESTPDLSPEELVSRAQLAVSKAIGETQGKKLADALFEAGRRAGAGVVASSPDRTPVLASRCRSFHKMGDGGLSVRCQREEGHDGMCQSLTKRGHPFGVPEPPGWEPELWHFLLRWPTAEGRDLTKD